MSVARMARLLRQQDHSGYGPTLIAALSTISKQGPITLGDLAAREQVAPPTITKVVEKLMASGLVARTTDASDRRVSRVAVTRKGTKQLDVYRTRRTEWLAQRLNSLTADERQRLDAALDVMEKIIEVPANECSEESR
ncbi:MAG TPA: MarR family transcriptional regulator [Ilumatobacteraceae bacterium]|nr:MarR family transcriptional regulator [Ilumatobacteraceae bacterium]HRB02595.1 MarR family transcriptional regulator [Ilumatobacteraceae bacterium]